MAAPLPPPYLETDEALDELIRTGVVAIGEERARVETRENWVQVRMLVADLDDPAAAWAELGRDPSLGPGLASPERLFHTRGCGSGPATSRGFGPATPRGLGPVTPRRTMRSMRAASIRVALCPSPSVPPAPCLAHPISMDDVVRFGVAGTLLAGAEALANRAARALDAIGDGTSALAGVLDRPSSRRPVWTRVLPHRVVMTCRPALLLMVKLLEDLGDGRWWSRGGLLTVPAAHYSTWSTVAAEAVGARAWVEAVRRGVRVSPTHSSPGSRFYVRKDAVGLLYSELENPFASLLRLRTLGISPRGFSREAVVLALSPMGPD